MTVSILLHLILIIFVGISPTTKCSLLPSLAPSYEPPILNPSNENGRFLLSKEILGYNRTFYQPLVGTWNSTLLKTDSGSNLHTRFEFEKSTGKLKTYVS